MQKQPLLENCFESGIILRKILCLYCVFVREELVLGVGVDVAAALPLAVGCRQIYLMDYEL